MGPASTTGRGFALRGRLWTGGTADVVDDGVVIVDSTGRVAALGPAAGIEVPADLLVVGDVTSWVGPGIIDAHVHLAFGAPADVLAGGVTTARDLGAPITAARRWRNAASTASAVSPRVSVAGPLLTAPGGYPSRSWGRDGFAIFAADPDAAADAVRALAVDVDIVKLALEPAGGPVPDRDTVNAVVRTAHDTGLAVIAHALTVESVRLALSAGVDELAHLPVEPLPEEVIAAIAGADIAVVSTVQTFLDAGVDAATLLGNATRLHAAGVRLAYGTDLGNTGTRPGVDPRELGALSRAGLGPLGALRAATDVAAGLHAMTGASGLLAREQPADVVVLRGDPVADPRHWRAPLAVAVAGRIVAGAAARRP